MRSPRSMIKLAMAFLLMGLGASCEPEGPDGIIENLVETEEELRICASGTSLEGIDVSTYQGKVDWSAVRRAGKRFAFARVSYGTSKLDNQFARNWQGMKAAGLFRGVYQYFLASQDPIEQADLLIQKVGKLSPRDLPAVLDLESQQGVSDRVLIERALSWLERVAAGTGKRPIVYTSIGFFNTLEGNRVFADHVLWAANYGVRCPSVPEIWKRWGFWQHSETGRVAGISGNVDLDVFNGSLADLEKLARGDDETEGPVAPTPGFTFPSNAKVSGDFFFVRDAEGNVIEGRRVDDGDRITVLDVGYSSQLVRVQYPTPSGMRSGFINNVASLIHYDFEYQYQNGSTPEPVYDESGKAVIGSIDPHEKATPIYRGKNGMLHVVYNTADHGPHSKSGYVKYNGGFTRF